jgi:hypothetical protein
MTSCAICLTPLLDKEEDGNDVTNLKPLRCGHILHRDCCEKWFLTSKTTQCPLCRRFHTLLNATGQLFLGIILIDLIRFLMVSYMAYQYYITGKTPLIFLYILVDVLVFFQAIQSGIDTTVTIDINFWGFRQTLHMTDIYMLNFGFSVVVSLLQLRLWIPSVEFFVCFCLMTQSLYTSVQVLYASINS